MDETIKLLLNTFFMKHYSKVYTSKPTLKSVEDTNYYYVTNDDSNIICLIPFDASIVD